MVVVRTSLARVRWWGGVVRRMGVPGRDLSNGLCSRFLLSPHLLGHEPQEGSKPGVGWGGRWGVSGLALVAHPSRTPAASVLL